MSDTRHNDQQLIERTHNTARFFTETRHVSWVLLVGTVLWGVYGYLQMPQRKDPDIPIRQALALCPWPGASAEKIEQLVTRRIEEKIAENVKVEKIESNTRTGITAVYITLVEGARDTGKEFDDIKLKLDTITDLPDGAGPIDFVKDFGDTAALMLTVASPRVDDAEIAARASALQQRDRGDARAAAAAGRRSARDAGAGSARRRCRPSSCADLLRLFADAATADGLFARRPRDHRPRLRRRRRGVRQGRRGARRRTCSASSASGCARPSSIPTPGRWSSFAIRPRRRARLARRGRRQVQLPRAGRLHRSHRPHAEDAADRVEGDALRPACRSACTSSTRRSGSPSYGVKVGSLERVLGARNITLPGGIIEVGDKNLTVDPSGEFKSEQEIGDVLVPTAERPRRSTCATWRPSAAATRARRGS